MIRVLKAIFIFSPFFYSVCTSAQDKAYPKGYFRNPLNIPIQLVANFGELRSNHWHMGLDIRTQQKENLPVYAAAEGYIAKIKIEANGFGRAIYINHPNGFTTVYAHLNNFFSALENWVKEQQYKLESWAVELTPPAYLFQLSKGQFFAYSGNTGGSQGPHVHFEIRDTKTDECLNPLLFGFSFTDAVPPTLTRLAMYDRNRSVYAQPPQLLPIKKIGAKYGLAKSNSIKTGTNKISFAIGAVDRLTSSGRSIGIYSAKIFKDDILQSAFILDKISYDDTRYMNAHIDYRYKMAGGSYLQHISRMPGDESSVYTSTTTEGVINLPDTLDHVIRIELRDAAQNLSVLEFNIQFDKRLYKPVNASGEKLIPNYVSIVEKNEFEFFATEHSFYDTVIASYSRNEVIPVNAISPLHLFLSAAIPVHDSVTVRILSERTLTADERSKTVIQNISGTRKTVEKAKWGSDWAWAKFRQLGSFQAFIDDEPPTINAPGSGNIINLQNATRIIFTPKDNFNLIKNFRAELDGKWLRFTNDKGRSWIYKFDEKFPKGEHQLKVTVEDEAGNTTTKIWSVKR
ncbi:MAG: peptidoglycan DD-metalloendopeptidase family protein [Chitinophagaceae bacterium]